MPLSLTQPQPLAAAVQAVSSKTPVGSAMRTRDWETKTTAGIREQAFYSAGVESVRVLSEMQDGIGKILAEVRSAKHGGYEMDRGKFIRDIQQRATELGLRNTDPKKRGTLEDFGSEKRLKLILEQQIGAAQAKAYWEQGNDPDLLDAFPALRLIRVRSSKVKRDWKERWSEAANGVGWTGVARNGEWVALKDSPIWTKLSRFERPYPPFDFNSGMGVEEVAREDAEALGLIAPGQKLENPASAWKQELEASVKTLKPDMVNQLRKLFGDRLEIVDGIARVKPGGIADAVERMLGPADGGES